MLELARRGVLGVCLLLGLWLYFLPDPTPLWTVEPAGAGQGAAARVVTVSGPLWRAYFRQADQALAGAKTEKAFARRLGQGPRSDGSVGPKLYYKYYDPPLSDLGGPDNIRLRLEGTDLALSLGVFVPHPGTAPGKDQPPASLTHPWRKTGWKAWPAGLLTALFLPWPAGGRAVLRWPRRKIVALDVFWLAFAGLFFGLPLAIFHGMAFANARQAVMTVLCWGAAGLGLALGRVAAARAARGVLLADQGVTIIGLGEEVFVPYGGPSSARLLAPCGWRRRLGWFASWTVALTLRNGETLLVNLGDAEQADRLVQAFEEGFSEQGPAQ